MNFITVLVNGLLIAATIWWFHYFFKPQSRYLFAAALVARIIAALSLGLIYKYYYDVGDTWMFFNESVRLADQLRQQPGSIPVFFWSETLPPVFDQNIISHDRSLLFVKILIPLTLVSQGSYWVSTVYFALLSFSASWLLFKTVRKYYPAHEDAAVASVLFFPSVIFWSSGIVKETVALAGIFTITAIALRWVHARKLTIGEWLLTFICVYMVWRLKYYWAAMFVVTLIATVFTIGISNSTGRLWRFGWAWIAIFLFAVLGVTFTHPNFYLSRLLEVIVENNREFALLSERQTSIHYYSLQATWYSMLLNAPWALFSGLFRPFVWESHGWVSVIASVENLLLFLLFITWLISVRRLPNKVLLPVLTFCVLLCVCLALSTPNFGTLSRYRVGFLPFFVFILLGNNQVLKKLIPSGKL